MPLLLVSESMQKLPFHPALEGLRGLAVLAVLLFHGEVPGFGGGFLGVSTFFTLSGFLITGLLVTEREQHGRIALGRFWARRFRRLMPAALLALAMTALLGLYSGDSVQRERLPLDGVAALFYYANWWLVVSGAAYADLMGSPSWLQHFWSLAIEEQYYAVFPLVAALLLRRTGRRALAVALALGTLGSFVWMGWLSTSTVATARIYYGTDTRAGELLIGGLLALWITGRPRGEAFGRMAAGLGVVGLGVSAWFVTQAQVESVWLYAGGLPAFALASAALVLGCVAPGGPVRRLLSLTAMRWLGRISYGVYVFHWPLFLVLDPEGTGLSPAPLFALRCATTLGLATASYLLVEAPIRRGALRGWRVGLAAPAAAGLVLALLLVPGDPRPPDPTPVVRTAAQEARARRAPQVAVIGDSMADQVAQGLAEWSARTGRIRVENLSVPGCGLARGAWGANANRRSRSCDRWPEILQTRMRGVRPKLVLIGVVGWDLSERELPEWGGPRKLGDPEFDAWLRDEYGFAIDEIARSGAMILWLTTPCTRHRVGSTVAENDRRVRHMNEAIIPQIVADDPRVFAAIDLDGAVCPEGRFVNRIRDIEPFRPDGVHFSAEGRRWLGEWLGPRVLDVGARAVIARRHRRGD